MTKCGVTAWTAGTDMLGYRLPPDRSGGFDAPSGTDVRLFCHPPDLVIEWLEAMGSSDELDTQMTMGDRPAGTDVRQFQRSPDRATELMSFRVFPMKVGSLNSHKVTGVPVETDELWLRRHPIGRGQLSGTRLRCGWAWLGQRFKAFILLWTDDGGR